MHTTQKNSLVSSDKVMERLGYKSRVSFWDAVKRLGIPRYQIGTRKVLFDLEEVEAWLKQKRVGQEVSR